MGFKGRFFSVNDQGMVLNPTHLSLVNHVVTVQLPSIIQTYQNYFDKQGLQLHSVYLRGSAARGLFTPGISDVDTLALVESQEAVRWESVPVHTQPLRYNFSVEWIRSDWFTGKSDLHPRVCQIIKTQALPIWGTDIRPELPEVPLSTDLVLERKWLSTDYQAFVRHPTPVNQAQLLKTLIRAKGGSLLVQAGTFTPDLDLCVAAMVDAVPAHKTHWQNLLQAYLYPSSLSKKVVRKAIEVAMQL